MCQVPGLMARMPPAPRSSDARAASRGRQRSSHSLEAILETAITLLDESGEAALTFRELAARLGGGVGSIYWYVAGKDELLDRATDAVMGEVLAACEPHTQEPDPVESLRAMSLLLFGAMLEHPWVSNYLLRNVDLQPQAIRLYERFGQQLQRLDLSSRQRFWALSALLNYVIGAGAQLAPERGGGGRQPGPDRAEIEVYADGWRALDPQEFPFVHEVADIFAQHDDADDFRAGLVMMLSGLRHVVRQRAEEANGRPAPDDAR